MIATGIMILLLGMQPISQPTPEQVQLVRKLLAMTDSRGKSKIDAALAEPSALKFQSRDGFDMLEVADLWAGFSPRSGQLLTFGVSVPKAGAGYREESAKTLMSGVAELLGLQGDHFEVVAQRPVGGQAVVTVNGSISGIPTTQGMFGIFDVASGYLVGVRCYDRLDFDRFKNFKVPQEQAEESAMRAYASYAPFNRGRLWRANKVVGIPIRADESIPTANEVTEEQLQCFKDKVAIPFYEFIFIPDSANPEEPATHQVVIIDARDGRAMFIALGQKRSSSAVAPKIDVADELALSTIDGRHRVEVRLSSRASALLPDGVAVPLRGDQFLYAAKFDESHRLLWIDYAGLWRAYELDKKSEEALNRYLKAPLPKFGRRKG